MPKVAIPLVGRHFQSSKLEGELKLLLKEERWRENLKLYLESAKEKLLNILKHIEIKSAH